MVGKSPAPPLSTTSGAKLKSRATSQSREELKIGISKHRSSDPAPAVATQHSGYDATQAARDLSYTSRIQREVFTMQRSCVLMASVFAVVIALPHPAEA